VEAIGIGVAITVISALILALGGASWHNRAKLKQTARERFCRHEWEPINEPGDGIVLVTEHDDWCVKCDARR